MMKLTIDGYPNKKKNKYYKWYTKIVLKAIDRNDMDGYYETHHILPKSLGGSNKQENLVKLSGREHYICHWLLTKFIIGDDLNKMVFALHFMSYNNSNRYFTSKIYESQKIAHSNAVSITQKRLWSSESYKKKMSLTKRLSWSNGARNEQLAYMKENSPFKIKEIHAKTIETRTKNGTNIWITNNPMKDPIRAKEIAKSRSGTNHYLNKNRSFYYRKIGNEDWIEIKGVLDIELTKLKFPRATFMKMIHNNYRPKRGALAEYEVKRVLHEDN